MIEGKNWNNRIFNIINYTVLAMIAFLCLAPFIHVLAVSLSSRAPVMGGFVTFWPIGFTLENYNKVVESQAFYRSFLVSVERTLLGTLINLMIIILCAYPFSKSSKEFKGRNLILFMFLFAMLFNGGLIPTFLTVRQLKLFDTLWALVLPGAVQIWSIFMLMNFFRELPKEIEESAIIDGASHWQVLYHIFLPLSLPALATLMLFAAVGHWNSWFDGVIYMTKMENVPLQTFLRTIVIQLDMTKMNVDPKDLTMLSNRAVRAAQIFITMLPILVVYPFLQRYFVAGIRLGAVKG